METDIVKKQNVVAMFVEFLPSATIIALNIAVPTLFSNMVAIEYRSPDAVVQITVARSVVLRLASIVVLVVSLHARITNCRSENEYNENKCRNCKEIRCWETYVGIEFYKIAMMDFFVNMITTASEFIRKYVKLCTKIFTTTF
ncbi:hypothetical protein NP493_1000g00002 [Ridgeia piscesae]|uniref:TMC domain-containing protein n=1 Tax=Ridgeia piscesae TaxID=27915 RepID=A0AAD9KIW2_RIDPI|nr:hypothetical protein NP493_1000g00002 [Ridgeia piscesae]